MTERGDELALAQAKLEAQRCVLAAVIGRLLTAGVLTAPMLRALWADALASAKLVDLSPAGAPRHTRSVGAEVDQLMHLMAPALRRSDV